jgi:hypothetical protein
MNDDSRLDCSDMEQASDSYERRIAALQAKLTQAKAGRCLKCNMGPLRESCAYPEACEHPGRELANNLTTVQLELAQAVKLGDETERERIRLALRVDTLEQDLAQVRQERDDLVRDREQHRILGMSVDDIRTRRGGVNE